jgi:hypothetical protein
MRVPRDDPDVSPYQSTVLQQLAKTFNLFASSQHFSTSASQAFVVAEVLTC